MLIVCLVCMLVNLLICFVFFGCLRVVILYLDLLFVVCVMFVCCLFGGVLFGCFDCLLFALWFVSL